MVILVDMDDVLERLVEAWCRWLNEKHGTAVQAQDVTHWGIRKFFPTLTRSEVFAPLYIDDFWATVRPRADAIEYIMKIHEDGDEIYVVTASDYRTIKSKFDYVVRRYFPWISWDHMIIASNKQMIKGDILVDDGIHNLVGGCYEKILMTAPHNQHIALDASNNTKDIRRADSWEDVYDIIQEIKRKAVIVMKVIKRNGELVDFDRSKIVESIRAANDAALNPREKLTKEDIQFIVSRLYERIRKRTVDTSSAEIEDMVSIELMKERAYEVANIYIKNSVKKQTEASEQQ